MFSGDAVLAHVLNFTACTKLGPFCEIVTTLNLASKAFRITTLSSGIGAAGFISMTEPSTLAEKAIGRLL